MGFSRHGRALCPSSCTLIVCLVLCCAVAIEKRWYLYLVTWCVYFVPSPQPPVPPPQSFTHPSATWSNDYRYLIEKGRTQTSPWQLTLARRSYRDGWFQLVLNPRVLTGDYRDLMNCPCLNQDNKSLSRYHIPVPWTNIKCQDTILFIFIYKSF